MPDTRGLSRASGGNLKRNFMEELCQLLVRLTLTAILFVRLIVTVVDLVTTPVRSDAVGFIELVVAARELPGLAVWRG